ncbi:LppX_LprAFG lipoprotein [Nocardioides dilutus]
MTTPPGDGRRAGRALALLVLLASGLLAVAGCSEDAGLGDGPPDKVLAAAKTALDETSGVSLSLTTDKLPSGVDGVREATGVATNAPAFEGELTVVLNGLDVDVPVIAVDGKVWARLPFTSSFAELNPADYGAPDPAQLMAAESGLSSWLAEATGVEKGDQVRRGDSVLSTYSGTLSGEVVDATIPMADETAEFPVTFRIDEKGLLRSVLVSGPFYGSDNNVEYTVDIDDYGTTKDIEAP